MMDKPLFRSEHIYLSGVDPEKDASVEAGMTYDLDYAAWFRTGKPPRPLDVSEVKKYYETALKHSDGADTAYHFAIRLAGTNDLAGFVRFSRIEWSHAAGRLEMAIGKADLAESHAEEALSLALTYAFEELNLYRLAAATPSYDLEACRRYDKAGFTLEVRQREAVFREGQYWDWLLYGILCEEWAARKGDE